MSAEHKPCPGCPWRKAVEPGGEAIPGFDIELMRRLGNTVGPGDAMRPIMACHHSKPGKESHCRGYIARHGWSNIGVRLLAMRGRIPVREIVDACESIDLWPDFETMLAAYEDAQP